MIITSSSGFAQALNKADDPGGNQADEPRKFREHLVFSPTANFDQEAPFWICVRYFTQPNNQAAFEGGAFAEAAVSLFSNWEVAVLAHNINRHGALSLRGTIQANVYSTVKNDIALGVDYIQSDERIYFLPNIVWSSYFGQSSVHLGFGLGTGVDFDGDSDPAGTARISVGSTIGIIPSLYVLTDILYYTDIESALSQIALGLRYRHSFLIIDAGLNRQIVRGEPVLSLQRGTRWFVGVGVQF